MKKFFTLLFAVVTVAAFAFPVVQTNQKKAITTPQLKMNSVSKVDVKAHNGVVYNANTIRPRAYTDAIDTLYQPPVGSFFLGYFPYTHPQGGYSAFYYMDYMLLPGSTDVTWQNVTNGTPDSFHWEWYNPDIDDVVVSEEANLTTNVRNDGVYVYPAPYLWAMTPTSEDDPYYTLTTKIQYGGKMEIDLFEDGSYYTNMMPFSPTAPYGALLTPYPSATGTDARDTTTIVQYWKTIVNKVEGADFCEPVAHVSILSYPGRPYAFSRMTLHASAIAREGQTVTGMVCPVEDGLADLDHPMATATYKFSENVDDEDVILEFNFEEYDPELDLIEEKWLTIDKDVALVFTGTNELQQFWPYANGVDYDWYSAHANDGIDILADWWNAYNIWNFYSGDQVIASNPYHASNGGFYVYDYKPDTNNQEYLYACPNSFCVGLNAQFAFIEDDETAAVEETIPAEGGTFNFTVRASEPYDAWNPENMPEGVTVVAEDLFDEDENYTCKTNLTVTVAPNTNATVVYTLPGTEFKIIVGDGGAVVVPGDVNGDGVCNSGDVTSLYNFLLNGDTEGMVNGDVNGDGSINSGDITFIYNLLLGSSK